jgi:hypothetical protein
MKKDLKKQKQIEVAQSAFDEWKNNLESEVSD